MSIVRERSHSYTPPPQLLRHVLERKRQLEQAMARFEHAMLIANEAGHSMREIGAATGLSASTVYRAIVRAEKKNS